ncbi:MAG: sterol desaturase family protein [Oligoflexus sp.]
MNIDLTEKTASFLIIGTIVIEFLIRFFVQRKSYDHKDSFTNLLIGIGNRIITGALWLGLMLWGFQLAYDLTPLRMQLTQWWVWPVAILMSDFSYYWYHRLAHEIRGLWVIHAVHHNSEDYNFSTSVRLSWLEGSVRWMFWLPLPLAGLAPLEAFLIYMITRWYQVLLHTQYVPKLGFLEKFLSTPSHHRVHHGANPKYIDKNYGGMFIFWDKLFGSFQVEEEAPVYGTLKSIDSYNPVTINFAEGVSLVKDMAHARNLKEAIGYAVHKPGWSPDGSSVSLEELFEQKCAAMRADLNVSEQQIG